MNTTKILQPETPYTTKQRQYRLGLTHFAILIVLGFVLHFGYCWGLWGRHSLLLQYLFQCSCPPASEEARYPAHIDVIIPACQNVGSKLSPSGSLLYIREEQSGFTYMLDLQTGEKTTFTLPEKGGFYFLTDALLYVTSSNQEDYILDRTTGDQYPVQRFSSLHSDAYVGGYANTSLLAEALHEAKYVFFRDYDGTIIALDPNFPISTENNFVIDRFGIPGRNPDRTEQFLKENNMVYQTISPDFQEEAVSPDKRFIARGDGIYLVQTGQKIVNGVSSSVRGWTNDGRGVIYSRFRDPCLIRTNFFIFDDHSCYLEVPQPVLKLKVPEEYLLPPQTP